MSSLGRASASSEEPDDDAVTPLVEAAAVHRAHLAWSSAPDAPGAEIKTGERKVINQVIDRLAERNPDITGQNVADIVNAYYVGFEGHPIRDYIPLLVERAAREHITHLRD
jgi:hypothetical protein